MPLAVLFLLAMSLQGVARVWTDELWFESVGQGDVAVALDTQTFGVAIDGGRRLTWSLLMRSTALTRRCTPSRAMTRTRWPGCSGVGMIRRVPLSSVPFTEPLKSMACTPARALLRKGSQSRFRSVAPGRTSGSVFDMRAPASSRPIAVVVSVRRPSHPPIPLEEFDQRELLAVEMNLRRERVLLVDELDRAHHGDVAAGHEELVRSRCRRERNHE